MYTHTYWEREKERLTYSDASGTLCFLAALDNAFYAWRWDYNSCGQWINNKLIRCWWCKHFVHHVGMFMNVRIYIYDIHTYTYKTWLNWTHHQIWDVNYVVSVVIINFQLVVIWYPFALCASLILRFCYNQFFVVIIARECVFELEHIWISTVSHLSD